MTNIYIIGGVIDSDIAKMGNTGGVSFDVKTTSMVRLKTGETKTFSEWHKVKAWNYQGETLHKGYFVLASGSKRTESFEGRDGTKKKTVVLNADSVTVMGGGATDSPPDPRDDTAPPWAEDIPF